MSCIATRRNATDHDARQGRTLRGPAKPVLDPPAFLALLNERLRAHPMYLEGMAFPVAETLPDDGDHREDAAGAGQVPHLVQLLRDTRWDHFGVFASVIDEVKAGYELSAAVNAGTPCRQRLAPLGTKPARLRQVTA
jgi:hypothetical protein